MFFINTSGRRITKTFKCMVHFASLCNYKYDDEILKWSWKTITIKLFFQLLKLTKSYIELWFMKLFWLTPSLIIVSEVEKNALGEHGSSFQFSDCWWCFSMEKTCWLWLTPGFFFFFLISFSHGLQVFFTWVMSSYQYVFMYLVCHSLLLDNL